MTTRFQAVIFDMDGVIVDSESRHAQAFHDVMREIGYADNPGLRFEDYIGRADEVMWADFVARNRPVQTAEELLVMKRQRVLDLIRRDQPLFNGLPELIAKLSRSYRLALASGSERVIVDEVLALRGLRRFFGVTISASDNVRGKPAPDIFLRAAELLGVRADECWVIEDSKPGIAAALAAGMPVIAITNTYPATELSHATHVVASYGEIERLLL